MPSRASLLFLTFFIFALARHDRHRDLTPRSNYDPHYPSNGEGLFFEGWYFRIVDPQQNRAIAALGGSFCANNQPCKNMQGLPGYFAMMYKDASMAMRAVESFPNETYIWLEPGNEIITGNPDFASPPDFEFEATDLGGFTNGSIDATINGYKLSATMSDPIFWNPAVPGEGPEGIAMDLPLQQHWFVYSLGSIVDYRFVTPEGDLWEGSGFAHQEKNWGENFPSEWVWSEGISPENDYHFALTGGKVPVVGPVGVHAWLIGYRSPNLTLNFRPQDLPTIFTPTVDACHGSFKMVASHLAWSVEFDMTADVNSFVALAIPTQQGFVPNGCIESYDATVVARAYHWGSLVDEYTFTGAALEFGGNYLCNKQ
eukprot:TRINITY_DN2229_c0_g1_i1.p1 TRINITY_DN2229_c0_g1~~TRINITY_DN2229_c0_g1_i1.p1  ORF type:complete len:370 (-),score=78.24 TRINITY_DN2229_c0_g1_i1:91-1200(-)